MPISRYFILGTAGHIDHGKSSLVRALTGTDPDRLPEEKRRGMTIELGFAELTIDDTRFGIVDVPGHERFVRTMVSGATGIDIAVLVVAADDSVMPQTIEHVQILQLLGVRRAVVAISKTDIADETMIELVSQEVRELIAETPFADAQICPVSAVTGAGLDALRAAMYRLTAAAEDAGFSVPFRMGIDRVFTVQGRGTVVTGSVLRGQVQAGDVLEVLPAGGTCRIRDLQTHGAAQTEIRRGQRAALNLSGVERQQLERGAELATPGYLLPSHLLDVRVECLPTLDRPLKSTQTVRLEIGTNEAPARLIVLEGNAILPGHWGYAQLRSGDPVVAAHGQRFILRDENAARTIGGGTVLRPVSGRRRRTRSAAEESAESAFAGLKVLESGGPAQRVEEVLRGAGFRRPSDLQICARAGVELVELPTILAELQRTGRWGAVAKTDVCATPSAVEDLAARLTAWLERHHRAHPDLPGRAADSVLGWIERVTGSRALPRPLLDELIAARRFKRLGRFVCAPAFAPALSNADEKLLLAMTEQIRKGGFQPPSIEELSNAGQADRKRLERLATLAVALGDMVAIDGTLYLHAESDALLRERVAELIGRSGGVTVSEVREAIGSSRKFVVPFLEYLDRIGYTKRVGDKRVLNQRAG